MSSYILRGTDPALWKAAKLKAGSLSALVSVVERLLTAWVNEREETPLTLEQAREAFLSATGTYDPLAQK